MFIRFIVYWVTVFDVLLVVSMTHTAWWQLAAGWGDPGIFLNTPTSSAFLTVQVGIISATVQMFFAWRIMIIGRYWAARFIAFTVILIATMQLTASIVETVRYFTSLRSRESIESIGTKKVAIVWLAGSFTCDVVIASTMVFLLLKSREKTVTQSRELLHKLIINSVQTGTITAVVSFITLVLFLTNPHALIHLSTVYISGSLFSNVLLATLNGRTRLKSQMDQNVYTLQIQRTTQVERSGGFVQEDSVTDVQGKYPSAA